MLFEAPTEIIWFDCMGNNVILCFIDHFRDRWYHGLREVRPNANKVKALFASVEYPIDCIYQQDNPLCHLSKATKHLLSVSNENVLPWLSPLI